MPGSLNVGVKVFARIFVWPRLVRNQLMQWRNTRPAAAAQTGTSTLHGTRHALTRSAAQRRATLGGEAGKG